MSGKTKADFGHGQARFITYMNVFSNPISNPEMTEPIEIDPKQNEVEVGDVFFTTSSETPEEVGMSSVLLEKRGKIYLNSFCFGFRPTEKIDSYYLAYMLRSESAREKIILLAQGISRYNISKNKVMEIAVSLPSLDEQKLVGQYFRQLDNLITLHQRQPFLHSTPEISLTVQLIHPFYTSSWEQRKLGEVIRLNGRIGFRGYTEKDIVSKDDGGVLTFSPTNIVDNKLTTNCKNTYITRFKYDESPEIKIHNGDILFVKTGSTLGKSALVTGLSEDATLNPQVVVMRTNNLNAEFLAAMLVTNAIISQVNSAKIGGAVPTLTETRIKDFDVAIPVSEAEKEQIGQFFSQLDHLITLHQRKPFLMKWRTSDANRNQTNRLVL